MSVRLGLGLEVRPGLILLGRWTWWLRRAVCLCAELQGLDRPFKGQSLRPQGIRRCTAAIADDRGQHDSRIDDRAAALLCGGHGRVDDPRRLGVHDGFRRFARREAVLVVAEVARNVRMELGLIDATGFQHQRCVRILVQGQQNMLDGDRPMALLPRIADRALKRRAQIGRHFNPGLSIRLRLRHSVLRGRGIAIGRWLRNGSDARLRACDSHRDTVRTRYHITTGVDTSR